MNKLLGISFTSIALLAASAGSAYADHGGTVAGAIIGGAVGTLVGRDVGGRDGGIVGAAVGAGVGAAIGSHAAHRYHDEPVYYDPPTRPVHWHGPPPPRVWVPPPRDYDPPPRDYDPPPRYYDPPPRVVYPRPFPDEYCERHGRHHGHRW
jgi:hypothetical protein